MRELMQTNDAVLLSFVEVLLKDGGIGATVVDRNMSVIEGSLGILPRRVLVAEEDWNRARMLLEAADLGHHVSRRGESGE